MLYFATTSIFVEVICWHPYSPLICWHPYSPLIH